ncbi:MAG TPA: SDR family oxidoreductase [Candidatus Nanoarchaeia archaeon]|nr:SDR family oxidoreductase [Candidatus Nanoarchaeia archaeon]
MAKYLITGGAGFIGSNLAAELLRKGEDVVILDNFLTGKRENLQGIGSVTLIEGDIRDAAVLARAMRHVDFVLHQAALPSVPRSIENPLLTNSINIFGTLQVLLAARTAGVRRVVCASSSSVYGDAPVLPKEENMAPSPLSPYAVTKLIGEHYAKNFSDLFDLETVSLRYFNVFGPRQDPQSTYAAVIPRFIRALQQNQKPVVFGDGEQSRDFTFVKNVVQANILACTAKDAIGQSMNIATGTRYTLNQLLAKLRKLLGKDIDAEYQPARPGDVRDSLGSIAKAQTFLGYAPIVDFDEGLQRTVEWFTHA